MSDVEEVLKAAEEEEEEEVVAAAAVGLFCLFLLLISITGESSVGSGIFQ